MDDDPSDGQQPEDGPSLGGRDLLTLGSMLLGSVVTGVVVGLLLDSWLGTSPVLAFAGTMLGIVAAGVGFWLRVRTFLRG
ncbi:AtpZ/AtpI family protein [Aeromicrobium sp.]|uniref:AtpZ/AtpI family protein n=1 Tax=Aeromicrobium sp. TaxID=1871063 RepID=UPI003D6ABB0F